MHANDKISLNKKYENAEQNLSLKRHNLRLYRQNLKQRTMFPRNELDFQTVKLA